MDLGFLSQLFSLQTLIITIVGTVIGIIFGAIPGLNGGVGVAVMLPLTYSLEPSSALLFLGGIYMGSSYGGSISGILINCPGTVESACTAIEGHEMAKKGRGREALYSAVLSSGIGGLIGVIALIFFAPVLAGISVKFGPPEMFLVSVCGLAIVGGLTGKSISKGIFAALFGIFVGMIGIDNVTGAVRFTFGIDALVGGIGLIPVVIGMFAIAEMIKQAKAVYGTGNKIQLETIKPMQVLKDLFRNHKGNMLKSSFLGTIIGIIPGTGGAVASFLAYGEAKNTSKSPETFGKGNVEGIIAAETSNNAAVGGALVPMLALGIPGSSTTAIMFGALLIHGLIPGPSLFTDHGDTAYTFIFGMLFTVIFMVIFGILGTPLFSKILKVKMQYIIPAVLIFSIIGAYSVSNSITDAVFAMIFGLIGIIFAKFNIPTAPVILGLILGEIIESNLVRTLTIVKAQKSNFFVYVFTRPLSIVILLIAVYLFYANIKSSKKANSTVEED